MLVLLLKIGGKMALWPPAKQPENAMKKSGVGLTVFEDCTKKGFQSAVTRGCYRGGAIDTKQLEQFQIEMTEKNHDENNAVPPPSPPFLWGRGPG